MDTLRNSTFGQIVNHFSGRKILAYPEEKPGFVVPDKYLATPVLKNQKALHNEQVNLGMTIPESGAQSVETDIDLEKGSPQEEAETPTAHKYIIVDWYSDNDPENPQNWSALKKTFVICVTGLLTVSIYMGSSIYTPAVPVMMKDLNTTQAKAILPLTAFVLGYGFGPMVLSPLSEHVPLGRTYIYVITLGLFCLLQIPTALADTIEKIIGLRVIAGIFASPALSTGGATIGDVATPQMFYAALLLWSTAAFCGPTLGPLVGGIFTQLVDWRWNFWFLCILSGFSFCVLFMLLPETNGATILHRRAKRLRALTGNEFIKSSYEVNTILDSISTKELIIETFWRPIFIAFCEPIIFSFNVYSAFIYIIVNSWFEAFPIVFNELYHFNLIESGVTYVSAMIGGIIGSGLYYVWVGRIMRNENAEIEKFLYPAMAGSLFLPVGLFIFAWGASTHTHWIAPCIGALIFCIGSVNIFQSLFNYMGRGFYRFMASVFAGNCLMRSWAAAVFPLFVSPMYTNTATKDFPVGPGGSIIGGVAVLMIAIPFVIHRYGVRLRGRSKYAN